MNEVKAGTILKTSELCVGDEVRPVSEVDEGWDTCIVQQIDHLQVHFWRPYGHTDDFTVSGPSVICYVGIEEYSTFRDSSSMWKLLRNRRELK